MTHVVGIDLSTRAIDFVKLAENSNEATWVRCELQGATAWERTLDIRAPVHGGRADWWDDVYLVAIETPVNDQKRVLSRVQGAVLASLPAKLRQPHCCWDVHPSTWKAALGLKGKPTVVDFRTLAGAHMDAVFHQHIEVKSATWQNAMDAYCLALFARDTNAKAVSAALGETA